MLLTRDKPVVARGALVVLIVVTVVVVVVVAAPEAAVVAPWALPLEVVVVVEAVMHQEVASTITAKAYPVSLNG